jgi:hypothetical protein
MSSAIYKRLPVAASKLAVFERIGIHRNAAGASPAQMDFKISKKPLHLALNAAVQDVIFLEGRANIDHNLKNSDRETDPYLSQWVADLNKLY